MRRDDPRRRGVDGRAVVDRQVLVDHQAALRPAQRDHVEVAVEIHVDQQRAVVVVDGRGVAAVDHVGRPDQPGAPRSGATVLVQRHLAAAHVGATDHVEVAVAVHVAQVDAEVVEIGGDRVLGPGPAAAVVLAPDQGRSELHADDDVEVAVAVEVAEHHPVGHAAAAQGDAALDREGAAGVLAQPAGAQMDVEVAVAVEVAGGRLLLVGGGAQHGQRPGRGGGVVRHREDGRAGAAVVPGEHHLLLAADDQLADAGALEEVAAGRGVGDVEAGEAAGAVVARPGEVLAAGLAVGSQDVEVAVVVEVVQQGHVGELRAVGRRADGVARPGAAQSARVRVPPAAGREIRQAVAIEVAGIDEDRVPGQRGLQDVAPPAAQRQRRGLVLPHLDNGGVGRAVVPVGAKDVEVAVAADVADPQVVRPRRGQNLLRPGDSLAVVEVDRHLVRVRRLVHLGGHQIQVAVVVHVGGLEGVEVGHRRVDGVLGPGAGRRVDGVIPGEAAGALGGGQHHVEVAVAVDVGDGDPHVAGPAAVDGVRDPGRRALLLEPEAVVRDVQVAVAVEVAQGRAFAGARRQGHARPAAGRPLAPERGVAAVLLARDDVEIAVGLEIAELHVVMVGAGGADQMLGPGRGPGIAAGPRVLVPLEAGRVGEHHVQIAVAVDVAGLHVGGPGARGADGVLRPGRILVPEHAAAAGAGDDRVELAVAVDVAEGLAVGVGGVGRVDDDVLEGELRRGWPGRGQRRQDHGRGGCGPPGICARAHCENRHTAKHGSAQ